MSSKKTKELEDLLLFKPKNGMEVLDESEIKIAFDFCEGYKSYLDSSKTEREAVESSVALATECGFKPFEEGKKYKKGDKIYFNNRDKSIVFVTIGSQPIEKGVNIVAAHIDAPRLDFKPRSVYEEAQLGYFKTRYYGGVKKYQWLTIPLAIHGVVTKRDGSSVKIVIGEDESDPVFYISDLLPHLAKDQMTKTLGEGIVGENLNLLAASAMEGDEKTGERVKLHLLKLLYDKYGITERDMLTADIEVVPTYKARDVGLDRSFVGGYGHDDRICSYTALKALLDVKAPNKTACVILADKEEIGSEGVTGLNAMYFRYNIAQLAKQEGVDENIVFSSSTCLSGDVTAAFDPHFPEVYERKNSAYMNYGVNILKYTGGGGKGRASEATSEFMTRVCDLLDSEEVLWQASELGKIDVGGGGTVAGFLARLDIDTIDIGVPLFSMHAPFEVASKIDTYMAYKGYKAYFEKF